MTKKKSALESLKENEQVLSHKKAMKPETLFRRAVERKYKAWCELQPTSSVDPKQELVAFMAGARMGNNGVFKETANG